MPKRNHLEDDLSSDGEEPSLVNVDFDFFDPKEIDFIAIKRLLSQLFQADAEDLHTHELTELILSQPIGTTVKTDGIDSDPYAFLTVLNMNAHQENVAIQALVEYLLQKCAALRPMFEELRQLFAPNSNSQVGLILSERLINMPVQVAPHMYRLLNDEMRWAIDDNKPYNFSHYICVSRTYELSEEDEQSSQDVQPPTKRMKSKGFTQSEGFRRAQPYHPEDEIWEALSSHVLDYEFTRQPVREPGAVGAKVAAKAMILPASNFPELLATMNQRFATL
ncbi:hypothetical protein DL93DRAFT_2090391 [Clavulina sp. PMI_390]|nr:hypothetical protein DL93DRAFT_2090391 [Clavulina sp. PMI_390]